MFFLWILFVLTLLLGIVIGYFLSHEKIQEQQKKIIKMMDNSPVGAVQRPTAYDLRKPPKVKETEDVMRETIEKIKMGEVYERDY